MKLLTIIGARPQIIKAAAISRVIRDHFEGEVEECILHTGQHYDSNLNEIFFKELGIPQPDYNLGVGSAIHQTAQMLTGIEEILAQERFDGVIVYGDTNSTLAGALASAKMQIPLFHIEAGLRSFNMTMPEEQNRIVADHLSNICFAPTQTAVDNLHREGLIDSPTRFSRQRHQEVILSGDIMYDNTLHYSMVSERMCNIVQRLGLKEKDYILATVHRNYNTDCPDRLSAIMLGLAAISRHHDITVLLPIHPRTEDSLHRFLVTENNRLTSEIKRLRIIKPVSYLEMLQLERHAQMVMTDSGGVQKEAFFLERPCVILRSETEWVEIVQHGAGMLAGASPEDILSAYDTLLNRTVQFPPLFGNGHASNLIVQKIIKYLS